MPCLQYIRIQLQLKVHPVICMVFPHIIHLCRSFRIIHQFLYKLFVIFCPFLYRQFYYIQSIFILIYTIFSSSYKSSITLLSILLLNNTALKPLIKRHHRFKPINPPFQSINQLFTNILIIIHPNISTPSSPYPFSTIHQQQWYHWQVILRFHHLPIIFQILHNMIIFLSKQFTCHFTQISKHISC